jgi:hypothetical protein
LYETVLGLIVVVAMASPGCGGGDTENSSTTSPATTSSNSSAGSGGAGGEGGAGGAGGQGGGTADTGVSATETVSAGEVSKSPNYRMVFTFGQPTQNQGKTTSPSYRVQGGLVGANGSAP